MRKIKIIKLKCVDSTSAYAWELAQKGASEITVVTAQKQLSGKGRLGRSWVSPDDKGIYVSFIFRPSKDLKEIAFFPLLFAFSVVETVRDIIPVTIKLPNDVMAGNKKISGILVEARGLQQNVDFVILGIGINVNADKFELPEHATSLYLETNLMYDTSVLLSKLMRSVVRLYDQFRTKNILEILEEQFFLYGKGSFKNIEEIVGKEKKIWESVCIK